MTAANRHRMFFNLPEAFAHPVTKVLFTVVCAVLVLTPIIVRALAASGKIKPAHRDELMKRYRSWLIIAPMMIVPVILGSYWTICAVGVLSLLCYREFARATGLFRQKLVSLTVVLGIVLVTLSVMDHWYGFFVALGPLVVGTIAATAVLADRPRGFIQRVGLGVLAFMLFGSGLGHLGYFANDSQFVPILLMLLFTVELNDVFAYMSGKSLGHRKLAPQTSPNKTIAGSIGAILLTTPLVAILAHFVFLGTALDIPRHLVFLGLMVSVLGQLGDLLLSSVKRDLGIKDFAATFPGHGGLLDRFDSLILVAPAVFHYVGYILPYGIGADQPTRLLTGG